jgi:hypothetical protein
MAIMSEENIFKPRVHYGSLLLFFLPVFVPIAIIVYFDKETPIILPIGLMLGALAIAFYFIYTIKYELTRTHLFLYSGFIKKQVALSSVTDVFVEKTLGPKYGGWNFALDIEKIIIKFRMKNKKTYIYVSPKRKTEFIQELQRFVPIDRISL